MVVVEGGGQTGNETRPIQLIKASVASLISSGRHLQCQERTAGRLKAGRGGETQLKRAENPMPPIDPPPLPLPALHMPNALKLWESMNVPPEPQHRLEEVERGRERSGRRALLKESLFMICLQLPAEATIKNRI